MNNLSRNLPTALIVGVSGFLGSHVAEQLLDKGVQVVGVDNLFSSSVENLFQAAKSNRFHFIQRSGVDLDQLELPKLNYAIFCVDETISEAVYREVFEAFLQKIKEYKPKVLLVSSIKLYDSKNSGYSGNLKFAEKALAKFSLEHKLNARVVRLCSVYGPRMHWREEDPIMDLLQATFAGELLKESHMLDFTTRAIFVDDAVDLILKTLFHGSTAGKIFDGALLFPIKVSEVKQVLLDPHWYEDLGFVPTQLPPWTTPNLNKTQKDLSWKPKVGLVRGLKETVEYLKHHQNRLPKKVENMDEGRLEFLREGGSGDKRPQKVEVEAQAAKKHGKGLNIWPSLGVLVGAVVIGYGLLYPAVSLAIGAVSINNNLKAAAQSSAEADFNKADREILQAQRDLQQVGESANIWGFVRLPESLWLPVQGLVEAASLSTAASRSLYNCAEIISGEASGGIKDCSFSASSGYIQANAQIDTSLSILSSEKIWNNLPSGVLNDFKSKLFSFKQLISQGQVVSLLMGDLATLSNRKYLVVLQDSQVARPSGGVVVALGEVEFVEGRLKGIKAYSAPEIDQRLGGTITAPAEIKKYANKNSWLLEDSGTEPGLEVDAATVKSFYKAATGDEVNGVVLLNSVFLKKLLKVTGPLNLQSGQVISEGNLDSQLLVGDKSKEILEELLNRVILALPRDLGGLSNVVLEGVRSHDLGVVLDNPKIAPVLADAGWMGGAVKARKGDVVLGAYQSNLSSGQLESKRSWEVNIGRGGVEEVGLNLNIKNSSQNPYAGIAKIYLPAGFKVKQPQGVSAFSDYGLSGFLLPIELKPKEERVLNVSFINSDPVKITSSERYLIKVLKQAGVEDEEFRVRVNLGNGVKMVLGEGQYSGRLDQDKVFEITVGLK